MARVIATHADIRRELGVTSGWYVLELSCGHLVARYNRSESPRCDACALGYRPTRNCYGFRMLQVLVFVAAYVDATGESPTLREVADYLGMRHRQQPHLIYEALARRGWLVIGPSQRPRPPKLTVTPEGWRALGFDGERRRVA